MTNLCGVLHGQLAKVEQTACSPKLARKVRRNGHRADVR
jgi:hypothetical protein